MDSTADLRYGVDSCEAKGEKVTFFTTKYNCTEYFRLDDTDGFLRVAKVIDREVVDVIRLVVKVEDVASRTGPQIDKGKKRDDCVLRKHTLQLAPSSKQIHLAQYIS